MFDWLDNNAGPGPWDAPRLGADAKQDAPGVLWEQAVTPYLVGAAKAWIKARGAGSVKATTIDPDAEAGAMLYVAYEQMTLDLAVDSIRNDYAGMVRDAVALRRKAEAIVATSTMLPKRMTAARLLHLAGVDDIAV